MLLAPCRKRRRNKSQAKCIADNNDTKPQPEQTPEVKMKRCCICLEEDATTKPLCGCAWMFFHENCANMQVKLGCGKTCPTCHCTFRCEEAKQYDSRLSARLQLFGKAAAHILFKITPIVDTMILSFDFQQLITSIYLFYEEDMRGPEICGQQFAKVVTGPDSAADILSLFISLGKELHPYPEENVKEETLQSMRIEYCRLIDIPYNVQSDESSDNE